jgi:hypothetical protein
MSGSEIALRKIVAKNSPAPAGRVRDVARRGAAACAVMLLAASIARAQVHAATPADADAERRVREAVSRVYVHGVTEEVAQSSVGRAGLPVLTRLLFDPSFEHRDTVVAFLARLGDDATVLDLLAFLERPPAPPVRPEEDRALLLVPPALGYIAASGHGAALEALLDLTSAQPDPDRLACAASVAAQPVAYRQDLLEQAVFALGLVPGEPRAMERLADLLAGRVLPPSSRGLGAAAEGALANAAILAAPGTSGAGASQAKSAGGFDGGILVEPPPAPPPRVLVADPESDVDNTAWTYANHVEQSDPMTDARLDELTDSVNLSVGRSDFGGDIACCVTFTRSGTARSFGSVGDGLDVIDDVGELINVLSNPVARVNHRVRVHARERHGRRAHLRSLRRGTDVGARVRPQRGTQPQPERRRDALDHVPVPRRPERRRRHEQPRQRSLPAQRVHDVPLAPAADGRRPERHGPMRRRRWRRRARRRGQLPEQRERRPGGLRR